MVKNQPVPFIHFIDHLKYYILMDLIVAYVFMTLVKVILNQYALSGRWTNKLRKLLEYIIDIKHIKVENFHVITNLIIIF